MSLGVCQLHKRMFQRISNDCTDDSGTCCSQHLPRAYLSLRSPAVQLTYIRSKMMIMAFRSVNPIDRLTTPPNRTDCEMQDAPVLFSLGWHSTTSIEMKHAGDDNDNDRTPSLHSVQYIHTCIRLYRPLFFRHALTTYGICRRLCKCKRDTEEVPCCPSCTTFLHRVSQARAAASPASRSVNTYRCYCRFAPAHR